MQNKVHLWNGAVKEKEALAASLAARELELLGERKCHTLTQSMLTSARERPLLFGVK